MTGRVKAWAVPLLSGAGLVSVVVVASEFGVELDQAAGRVHECESHGFPLCWVQGDVAVADDPEMNGIRGGDVVCASGYVQLVSDPPCVAIGNANAFDLGHVSHVMRTGDEGNSPFGGMNGAVRRLDKSVADAPFLLLDVRRAKLGEFGRPVLEHPQDRFAVGDRQGEDPRPLLKAVLELLGVSSRPASRSLPARQRTRRSIAMPARNTGRAYTCSPYRVR